MQCSMVDSSGSGELLHTALRVLEALTQASQGLWDSQEFCMLKEQQDDQCGYSEQRKMEGGEARKSTGPEHRVL